MTQMLPPESTEIRISVAIPLFPRLPKLEPKPVDWQVVERVAQFERTAYLQALIADTLKVG